MQNISVPNHLTSVRFLCYILFGSEAISDFTADKELITDMEKTKEQILIEKLRKAGHKTRMGLRPGMPPMGGVRPPRMPGMPPHGPGLHRPPMGYGPMMGKPPVFPREMLLLALLEESDAGVRQKDIADKIGINASSLSEQIDRLESDHYLERRANPEDKRSTLIALTEKGKARAYEVQDERQKAAADFCSRLTDGEKDALIALLDKLLAE